MSVPAFHAWIAFNFSVFGEVSRESLQQSLAQISVRNLAAPELDNSFHTIAFSEEANCVLLLELVIVIIRIRPEFDFLYLDDVLLLFLFVQPLLLLVLPLTKIHDLGDGWYGSGRHEDQIETHVSSLADREVSLQDFNFTIGRDGADFSRTDILIDVFPNSGTSGGEFSARKH